jgi:hypothetical protein
MPRMALIKRVKPRIDGCILVDFDTAKPVRANVCKVYGLLAIMGISPEWMRYDKTRRGWHLIIKPLHSLSYQEILTAQAILGDDPKRGAYNFRRLSNGVWLNQLFEPCQ